MRAQVLVCRFGLGPGYVSYGMIGREFQLFFH